MGKSAQFRYLPQNSKANAFQVKNRRQKTTFIPDPVIFDPQRSSKRTFRQETTIPSFTNSRRKKAEAISSPMPMQQQDFDAIQSFYSNRGQRKVKAHHTHTVQFRPSSQKGISGQKPQQLYKRIFDSLKPKADFTKTLKPALENLFGLAGAKKLRVLKKEDLTREIAIKTPEGKTSLTFFDWAKALFQEEKISGEFDKKLGQIENSIYNENPSLTRSQAHDMKNKFAKGSFYERRIGLVLQALKDQAQIVDFKIVKQNSYLDDLGIDFLVKVQDGDQQKILALQVKASNSEENRFFKPRIILPLNIRRQTRLLRQGLASENYDREAKVEREGIAVIRPDQMTFSQLKKHIAKLASNEGYRQNQGIKLAQAPDFANTSDFEAIDNSIKSLEDTFTKLHQVQEEKVA